MEALVARFTQNVWWLPSRLTRKWNFQSRKNLDKFLKFCHTSFWQLALGTCSRLTPVAKTRVLCIMGLFQDSVQKLFSFPSHIVTVHCLPLPNSPCSLSKTPFFFIISSPIFKNRYGFSIFLEVFHISNPWFLGLCVLLSFEKYVVRIWFRYILLSLMNGVCGFSTYYAFNTWFHVCFSFLSSLSCLCCVVHIMLIVKRLIDTFLCLWELHRFRCTTYAPVLLMLTYMP